MCRTEGPTRGSQTQTHILACWARKKPLSHGHIQQGQRMASEGAWPAAADLRLGHLAGGQEDDGPDHVLVQLTDMIAHDCLHGPQDHRPVRMCQLRRETIEEGPGR